MTTAVPPAEDATMELASHLRAVVMPLNRLLRQQLAGEVTATQSSVLGSIVRHGPIRMSDLAAREQLSSPMITKVVDALVELGFVERVKDLDDGRACRVRVSEAGDVWLAASRERRDRWLAERLAELGADDQEAIAAALPAFGRLVGDPQ